MQKKLIEGGFNHLVEWKYGYMLYNYFASNIAESIETYGEYSEGESEIFRQTCREGFYAIDLGANIGALTIPLANFVGRGGKVFAFEAQKLFFQALTANVALNSLRNVFTYNLAVSNKDGSMRICDQEISYEKKISLSSFQLEKLKSSDESRGHEVKVVRLDDFYCEKRLNFIKIDIEGMEYEAIDGAKNIIDKFKPILYVENDRKEKSQALIELIQSLGYRLFWHLPPLFNKNNYRGVEKNIFENIVSANMLCVHKSMETDINLPEVTDSKKHILYNT